MLQFPSIRPRSAELTVAYFAYKNSGFREVVYEGMLLGSEPAEARLSLAFENEHDDNAALIDECYLNTISGALPVQLPPEIAAGVLDNNFKKRILLDSHLRWHFADKMQIGSVLGGAKLSTVFVELVASFDPGEIIDIEPPSPPTFRLRNDTGYSATDGITNDGVMLVLGIEDGATWEYSINDGATWLAGVGNQFTLPTAVYPIGYIRTRQTDSSGNLSHDYKSGFRVEINTVRPTIAQVRLDSSVGSVGGVLNEGDRVSSVALMSEGVVVVGSLSMKIDIGGQERISVYDPTTSNSSRLIFWHTIGDSEFDTNGISIPANSITLDPGASVEDMAGNAAVMSHPAIPDNINFIVDSNAPTNPTFALANDTGVSQTDQITSDGRMTVSSLVPGGTWQWSKDQGATWTPGNETFFTLPPGTYAPGTVRAKQVNAAGTASIPFQNIDPIVVDQTPPPAPVIVAGPSTAGVSVSAEQDAIVTLVFLGVDGGTASKQISGDSVNPVIVNLTVLEQIEVGAGRVTVTGSCVDIAGNVGPSATMSFTLQYTEDVGFRYSSFSSTENLSLVNAIGVVNNSIVLTEAVSDQVANIWNKTARRYDRDWSMTWRMYIGGSTGSLGADGFAIQWDTAFTRLGLGGYWCGWIQGPGVPWALLFHTWSYNNIQVIKAGATKETKPTNLNIRQELYYWLDYSVALSTMKIYISATSTKPATHLNELTGIVFPASGYHVGISAATGSGRDRHVLRAWSLTLL
jgi:hypothetical protein